MGKCYFWVILVILENIHKIHVYTLIYTSIILVMLLLPDWDISVLQKEKMKPMSVPVRSTGHLH